MNIAVTPRVGVNTRRTEDRLKAENAMLLTLPIDGTSVPVSATRDRERLQVAGLIECTEPKSRPTLWRPSAIGLRRIEALRRRQP